MSVFQTKVNDYPAIGVPGGFASVNPDVSTAVGRVAGADVTIGGFCWDDPQNDGAVISSGSGAPLGFVARDVIYPVFDLSADAVNIVPKGSNVNVQVKGDFFVAVPEDVENGVKKDEAVCVSLKTGEISSTGEDTGWVYATSAEAGGIAVISNY